jgi:hypothetical protein
LEDLQPFLSRANTFEISGYIGQNKCEIHANVKECGKHKDMMVLHHLNKR